MFKRKKISKIKECIFVEKITLNEKGIIYIKPQNYSFAMIYRSAMGVHWDAEKQCLYHNPTKIWGILEWYTQILAAVKDEYGMMLIVQSNTIYENIDNETILKIKELSELII